LAETVIPATSSAEKVISHIVRNHTHITIEQQLANHLDGLPSTERLQHVQDLLLEITVADDLVAEIASKIWKYVMTHKLWESKYPSLESFKESIAYDDTTHELLQRHNVLHQRHQAYSRSIFENWQSLPLDALPADLHPPKFSRNLLQLLSGLSQICPLNKAIVLLKEQVQRRGLSAGPFSYSAINKLKTYIIVEDVREVVKDLKSQMALEINRVGKRARYV
jgi:hypothetical protein